LGGAGKEDATVTKYIAVLLLIGSCSFGQAIYIGTGFTASPYNAGNVTFGVCSNDGGLCQLTNWEAKGTKGELKERQLHYAVTTGVLKVITSVTSEKFKVSLFGISQIGASVTTGADGFNGAVGGGIAIHPRNAPNWSFSIAAHGNFAPSSDPNKSKWQPWIGSQLGYTFHSVK
jgi:hypothetical protein